MFNVLILLPAFIKLFFRFPSRFLARGHRAVVLRLFFPTRFLARGHRAPLLREVRVDRAEAPPLTGSRRTSHAEARARDQPGRRLFVPKVVRAFPPTVHRFARGTGAVLEQESARVFFGLAVFAGESVQEAGTADGAPESPTDGPDRDLLDTREIPGGQA